MVFVVRVPQIAVRCVGPHVLSIFRAGFFDRFYFFAGVPAVELVEQVHKAHDIIAAVTLLRVHTVVQRNKPASNRRKQVVGVLAELDVVPTEA